VGVELINKKPYVKISAAFYLKDAPEGYLGLRSEHWNFGDEPESFDALIAGFIYHFLEFYMAVMPTPTDELNAKIQELGKAILNLRVEEKEERK